jgi:polyisoprenoid-binding protein YceI
MQTLLRFVLCLLLMTMPVMAHAATWEIDPAHASVEFRVRHLMVAWVKGAFPDVAGTVEIDETDLTKSKVSVTIGAASIDTNNAKRDEHLRSADFLDSASYPTMTFVSKKIVVEGGQLRQVIGDLTIRGTTREVTLSVDELTPAIKDPWGNTRRGATASAEINRKDFGLTWHKAMETGGVVVGDEVRIALVIELIRK